MGRGAIESADTASFVRSESEAVGHSGGTDTVTYCGDPATVREGFMVALDALDACSELLGEDAIRDDRVDN